MSKEFTYLIAAGALCCCNALAAPSGWFVARSPHFEVYSQSGSERAKAASARFEELSSFFDRNQVVQSESGLRARLPVRVIGFSSSKEYDAFRIRATADAYYTATAERDYIVLPLLTDDDFHVAAHEYAHFALSSRGLKLPAWLNEGIAELFSTVSITNRRCQFGGPIPARVETLRRQAWLTSTELFAVGPDSQVRETRVGAATFYAESWALTDMLTSSPAYDSRFGDLIGMLGSGQTTSARALQATYGKPPDAILREAKEWIDHAKSPRRTLPSISPGEVRIDVNEISEPEARAVQADLLFANGKWDRAELIYKEVLTQSPADPDILGSLGAVTLRRGDRRAAVEYFRKALDHNLRNAAVCYRYALLADEMDLPPQEIERALKRVIDLQPDSENARYKLALLKSNNGEYDAAVSQLQSMSKPSTKRAFGYWTALAYALSEVGKREEAESAAKQAMTFANTPEESARAAELVYVAQTDLAVRFKRDASGTLQLTTTRVPHGITRFNPFVEPGDQIQVATGKLRDVQCSEGRLTGFLVQIQTATLILSVPDPLHVLMRNSPHEFNCGPQVARDVRIEYATAAGSSTGLLRGMEFIAP